jgi:hypothetical protein
LGAIGVGTGVGHGKETFFGMLQFEVFVAEFLTIDRFSSGATVVRLHISKGDILVTSEIPALKHELWDDTVETAARVSLVHQRTFKQPYESILSGAQLTEVLGRLGNDIIVQFTTHQLYSKSDE